MTQFAEKTKVPVSKSKAEIENLLEKYGADQFFSGWNEKQAIIGFSMAQRQIKFVIPMPKKTEEQFTHSSRGKRSDELALKEWEQACRQRWRAMALVIKAKLEAVESGISEFEDEFMANIVMPHGQTVGQMAKPAIEAAYKTGKVQSLLPDYS